MKKSTIYLLIAHVISTVSKVVILICLTRFGGFEVAGNYTLALAVVTPVFIFFGLSLRQIFVTAREEPYFAHFFGMRAMYGAGGVLTVCVVAFVAFPNMVLLFLAMSLHRFIELLVDVHVAFVQRHEKVSLMALVTVLFSLGSSATLAGLFLLTGELTVSVSFACVSAAAVLGVVSTFGPKRNRPPKWIPTPSFVARTSRSGLMLSVSGFSVSMGTNVPVLLLGGFYSPSEVGVYSTIYYLSAISNILFSSVSQAELRGFSRLAENSEFGTFKQRGRLLSWGLVAPAAIGAGVVVLFGPEIFSWVFGPDFSSHQAAMNIVAVTICLAPFGFILDVQLTSLHKFSVQGLLSVATLALTVVLGFVLIPSFGILGCTFVVLSIMFVRNIAKYVVVCRTIRSLST